MHMISNVHVGLSIYLSSPTPSCSLFPLNFRASQVLNLPCVSRPPDCLLNTLKGNQVPKSEIPLTIQIHGAEASLMQVLGLAAGVGGGLQPVALLGGSSDLVITYSWT